MTLLQNLRKLSACAALALASLAGAGPAAAAPITVTIENGLSGPTLVPIYGAANGAFSLPDLLTLFQVVSGTVSANFTDDQDPYHTGNRTTGDYRLYGTDGNVNYYERDIVTGMVDPADVARLLIGGTSWTASSSFFEGGTGLAGEGDWEEIDGHFYRNVYYNEISGYTGMFSIDNMVLDALAIAEMNATGLLNFSVTGDDGDFFVNNVSVTLNLIDRPPVDVPEPGSLLLAMLMLGGLAAAWKVRRAKARRA